MLKLILAGNEVFVHGRSMREEVIIDQVTRFRDPKAIWSKKFGDGEIVLKIATPVRAHFVRALRT